MGALPLVGVLPCLGFLGGLAVTAGELSAAGLLAATDSRRFAAGVGADDELDADVSGGDSSGVIGQSLCFLAVPSLFAMTAKPHAHSFML